MTMPPERDVQIHQFEENGCTVTQVILDPADAQLILYGTVTQNGQLVGSYYPSDTVRQRGWRIVTPDGHHLHLDGVELRPPWEGDAVIVLTTILNHHDPYEIERRLRTALLPPDPPATTSIPAERGTAPTTQCEAGPENG